MPRFAHTAPVLFVAMLTTAAHAQFPGDASQNAAPAAQPATEPGNLDLNAIDRQAAPTEFGAPASRALAPQAPVAAAPVPLPGGGAQPGFGYIHQFGAFKITGFTAEGMFMLGANLPFPDGRRSVDFYQARLNYVGRFVDSSGISGHIYEAQVGGPVNDRRYFLFGDQDLNVVDNDSNGTRWVIYYNSRGQRTFSSTARFYKP